MTDLHTLSSRYFLFRPRDYRLHHLYIPDHQEHKPLY
ncbi:hypothetical protein D0525_01740 [Salmonella enterica]|nr:hypothetical protein [Salmonella enterica subsp. enterica]RXO49309.1 hypothetical protein D0525_01740 [Salmonella enterica]